MTLNQDRGVRRGSSAPLRQSSLRASNLGIVLKAIYAAPSPRSRADVATATGLTRSTVSRLVDELIAQGLVRELDRVFGGQRGRPAVPLVPQVGTLVGVGLEINVRHAAARLVDLAGTVLGESFVEQDSTAVDPESAVRDVALRGRELLRAAPPSVRLAGVQLALPGLVDVNAGVLLRAPNLGWRDVRPAGVLREVYGDVSVGVGNEADFAAVTMAWSAPGRPSPLGDFLYVSGEVGIGSALVMGGEVKTGRHGWAGELGHVCVDPNGPVCGCGSRGCLEVYVGQEALRAAAGASSTDELLSRLEAGDDSAHTVVADAARRLGIALAGALNLLDVSDVVLGGHLGRIAEHLLPGVLAELRTRVVAAPFVEPNVNTLANDTELAALGAAYIALADVVDDPVRWVDAEYG